jgi:hypothetical protein
MWCRGCWAQTGIGSSYTLTVRAECPARTHLNRENQLAVYRITRFAASDMGKVGEYTEAMRSELDSIGADFIDLISYGNGKGVVIAKYPDQAAADAASDTATTVFAEMIEKGIVEKDSVHPHMGEVFNSF